jgi:hypothetical protein
MTDRIAFLYPVVNGFAESDGRKRSRNTIVVIL